MEKMPKANQQELIVGTYQRKCSGRPLRSSSPVVLSGNRINTGLRRKLYLVPVFATILLVPADKYVLAGETITAPLIAPLYLLLSSAPTTTAGPSVSGTTDTTTTLSATINENGTGYYLVQEAAVAAPTIAAVLAGTSFAMSGGVATTQAISGLVALTPYKIYFVAKDAAGNVQAAVQSVDVTTTAEPDLTAPTTTAGPSVSGTTDTATTLSATINENGIGYYLVQEAAVTAPTVAAVLAGTSFTMTGGVAATQAISGLVAFHRHYCALLLFGNAGLVERMMRDRSMAILSLSDVFIDVPGFLPWK